MKRTNTRWRKLQQELAVWQIGAIPGLMVIGLIVFLRLLGFLQPLEWWALDYFLRLRPSEAPDEQILIVGIDEKDIQAVGTYPIPDANLAALVEKLQSYQPRAIGIDNVRDRAVPPGHDQFTQVLQKYDNLFGIEKALPDADGNLVNPPAALPPERVGFVDLIPDQDGIIRRALVGAPTESDYKFSLPMLLTERYLNSEDPAIVMENGIADAEAFRFGSTELTRFHRNDGGYVNADDRGNQFLINYRSGQHPFHTVTLSDVMQGKVPPDWIRDRLVLIGIRAVSAGDTEQVRGVDYAKPIYGVEVHAHVASQMINAVLHHRPWLTVWSDPWEYLWIIGWGILGISLGRFLVVPWKVLLGLGLASVMLIGVSFTAITAGVWLAVVPAFLVLVFNGTGLTAALFYRHQQDLQARLSDRQLLIDTTYTEIHNHPVQTLARILQRVREGNLSPQSFYADLERLEQQLRSIEESVRQKVTLMDDQLTLHDGKKLDLHRPIHELLHEVYRNTLSRTQDYPGFATLVKIPNFEAIENRRLTVQQREAICRFMEEAICNAGKHAERMTRLEVSCKTADGKNWIRIADNGCGIDAAGSNQSRYGTKQAEQLAHQLGGEFRRVANSPKGTICELSYPVSRFWLDQLRQFFKSGYASQP